MFGDEKNLKDSNSPLPSLPLDKGEELGGGVSYIKTNKLATVNRAGKLIAALYMVTDIMDKEEPLRNKLRTLGVNIISDVSSTPVNTLPKISEIMSFLDIAGAVNLISEMNANILRKEFFELKKAIEESTQTLKASYTEVDLSELFNNDFSLPGAHISSTHLGVQKGSTLLKALKDISSPTRLAGAMAKRVEKPMSNRGPRTNLNFEVLKGQRRDEIISIIKASSNGVTITDIKMKATGPLVSCGEKTLQRELIGMFKDGVLKKTGKKRWSRYFIT